MTNFHLADLIVRFTVAYKARMSFVKILKRITMFEFSPVREPSTVCVRKLIL